MNILLRGACGLTMAVAFTVSLHAQWPSYPTPGVPRTAAAWLDLHGSPYTDALKMTVDQRIMADQELIELICNENEQSTKHFK